MLGVTILYLIYFNCKVGLLLIIKLVAKVIISDILMGLTKLCAADKNALCCRQKFLRELTGTRSGFGNVTKLGYSVTHGIDG